MEKISKSLILSNKSEEKIDIYKYTKENKLLGLSAISFVEFRDFFIDKKINIAVEIGTYQGISTAHMAKYVNKIYTFDIVDYSAKYKVWYDFGISNRIFYYTIENREDIKKVIGKIKFDFAFIDGSHTYKDVKADFELVKHCGRVLFHDMQEKEIKRFIDEIGAKCNKTVGYWEKKEE